MKVSIAGFNVDKSLINKLPDKQQATPETISAAYARISRSSKSVTDLRLDAINEVAKARESNDSIVFGMGHSSIAEHAVFNIDLIGISRYLTEFVQKSRFASFTEKSQRYVKLKNDYVIPRELEKETLLRTEYCEVIEQAFTLYESLTHKISEKYQQEVPELAQRKVTEMAKEDARYILPLATKTQMGMTINARSIENLLRRLNGLELSEAEELHKQIYNKTREVAPSLIRYVECEKFYLNQQELKQNTIWSSLCDKAGDYQTKVILNPNLEEEIVLAGYAFANNPCDFETLKQKIALLNESDKRELFEAIFREMRAYHSAPRELELIDCLVQCSISASCFAQLKRHRLFTIIRSDYRPEYGTVLPETVLNVGLEEAFMIGVEKQNSLYAKLEDHKTGLGNYALTNSHKLRLVFKANLREMYHFSRLRSDQHAQWEIRQLSQQIDKELRRQLPNLTQCLMGKDCFSNKQKGTR